MDLGVRTPGFHPSLAGWVPVGRSPGAGGQHGNLWGGDLWLQSKAGTKMPPVLEPAAQADDSPSCRWWRVSPRLGACYLPPLPFLAMGPWTRGSTCKSPVFTGKMDMGIITGPPQISNWADFKKSLWTSVKWGDGCASCLVIIFFNFG